jgi:hypothetical protein
MIKYAKRIRENKGLLKKLCTQNPALLGFLAGFGTILL